MKQTPVHEQHNPDLLRLMPVHAKKVIEIGCSSGALAREFKLLSPGCDYVGVEIDPEYAELAKRHCDRCLTVDVESVSDEFWATNADRDCWVFGDTLEHLRDPWAILQRIRSIIPADGAVVACIPNAQHWSLQMRLSTGSFRYEANGLLDRTHLRWFTRQTIIESFEQAGFKIAQMGPRIFDEPDRDGFLPAIEEMAFRAGFDPDLAVSDALALQYVILAHPV